MKYHSHYELIMSMWKMLVTMETKGIFTGNWTMYFQLERNIASILISLYMAN